MNLERKKITVIGPSGVGKTTLIFRMCYDAFEENIKPTIGASFSEKEIRGINEQDYVLQFWDTAGMERYATIVPAYYPRTYIFWMVFDLSDKDSLRKLQLISITLFQRVTETPRIYLIGNKKDICDSITWKSDVEQFMTTLPYVEYFEVSAKSGQNLKLIEYQLQKDCCTIIIPRSICIEIASDSGKGSENSKKCC